MFPDLVPAESSARPPPPTRRVATPALFSPTERAERRFWEFFTAHIWNRNTRLAYLAAVRRFAEWCERRGLALDQVEPVVVAAYVEELTRARSPATVKQHLAALRMLFDWLVVGQVAMWSSRVRLARPILRPGAARELTRFRPDRRSADRGRRGRVAPRCRAQRGGPSPRVPCSRRSGKCWPQAPRPPGPR